jgi:hypothetical protein
MSRCPTMERCCNDLSKREYGKHTSQRMDYEHITHILTALFNDCLTNGTMPSVLKKTTIKCLYKGKGTKSLCTNYRPISIISSTSKIFEQIIYQRLWLSSHLENTNRLSDCQHGYRKARSTQSAIVEVESHIRKAGDDKLITGLVFADFSKAFDSINHQILIHQLKLLGVSGNTLSWFISYFNDRSISVQNGKHSSAPSTINRGKPQGSSLSGLLFAIYINCLPKIFKNCKAILYADDLVLWVSLKTLSDIRVALQLDLHSLDLNYGV